MPPPIPQGVPPALVAGMTWRWDDDVPDHPATDGWTLTHRLVGDNADLSVDASASGARYATTVAAADTAKLVPGTYRVASWVTKAGEKWPVATATVTVAPDPSAVAKGAQRSEAEQLLAEVRAAIRAIVQGGVQSYAIGTRSFTKLDLPVLRQMESTYQARVRKERTGSVIGVVKHSFGSAA